MVWFVLSIDTWVRRAFMVCVRFMAMAELLFEVKLPPETTISDILVVEFEPALVSS